MDPEPTLGARWDPSTANPPTCMFPDVVGKRIPFFVLCRQNARACSFILVLPILEKTLSKPLRFYHYRYFRTFFDYYGNVYSDKDTLYGRTYADTAPNDRVHLPQPHSLLTGAQNQANNHAISKDTH